jgi:hypothetical protein
MDTAIGYLEELRGDLVEAAWREDVRAPERRRRMPRPRSRGRFVALAAVLALVAAGGTGFVAMRVTREDPYPAPATLAGPKTVSEHGADEAVFAPATGATGATGASLGGNDVAVPAPSDTTTWDLSGAAAGIVVGPDLTRVVKTAALTVVVPNGTFDDRFGRASDVAERFGGFVSSATTRERSGSLTLRVDADRFGEALGALRAIGDVRSETVGGQDVTADYVDLEGRLRILEARRDVLLDLMAEATTIEQTLRVQNALDDVQMRIEQMKGGLQLLNDRTAKATIAVSLREADAPVELTQEDVRAPSLASAWRHGVAGFFRALFAVLVGLGYLLPVAIIGAAAWGVTHVVRRRRAIT